MADTPDDALIEAGQIAIHEVLRAHTIECTGVGEVSCRGCREVGWMSWWEYRKHVADLAARAAYAAMVDPPRCGAEQNTANLPDNNPPHVCVRPKDHTGPHGDYSGFEWDQPEPEHKWVMS